MTGDAPGWERLWRHSLRLAAHWAGRVPRHGLAGARVAAQRGLVPLDPWRYYELGRIADQRFAGRCLDVSSPKLLTSLLQREGQGTWTGVDLFETEIERWRAVDPDLSLQVEDATALSFPDASFDACICISVIEHVPGDGDTRAMAEMWRVLRPGGVLHLMTDVGSTARELFIDDPIYGNASVEVDGGVFFARHYGLDGDLERRLLALPWEVEHREYARQRDESIERAFYRRVPWSYAYGTLLRLRCADNFDVSPSPLDLAGRHHGVVYLQLRKPA